MSADCLMTADEAAAEWPRIDEAIGCLDCECIFRRPAPLSRRCPHCGSESIYDAARSGPQQHAALRLLRLVASLDAILTERT